MSIQLSGSLVLTGSLTVTGGITMSGSIASASYATSASYASDSSLLAGRDSGVFATTGSNIFVDVQYISSSTNPTGFTTTASLYTDGGARIARDMYVSGTAYFNNITVYGTQSVCFVTSSQLNISSNLISVNTATPSVRFGGLAVYDSGSTGLTGSILWDSEQNHWVYTNPSGSTYSGGMFIAGPRASSLGTEVGTTACALMMGQGGDHITSSAIFHYDNATCFYGTSKIESDGNACFSGTVCVKGNANLAAGLVINNGTGASGTCQHYINFNAGATVISRIFRGNGVSGLAGGGITIDNYDGMNIRLNQLGGSGGTLNITGGNVGINSSTALTKLHVIDDNNINCGCVISRFDNNGGNIRLLIVDENGTSQIPAGISNNTGFGLGIYNCNPNAAAGVKIFTGNCDLRVHIGGTGITCFSGTVCAPTLIISGAVGIGGVTSPSQCLEVNGIIKSSGAGNSVMFTNRNCSTATWEWYSQGALGSSFAGLYKNYCSAGTPLVVTDAGNVGIGITTPSGKLDIANLSSATITNGLIFTAADLAGANNGHRIGLVYSNNSTVRSSITLAFENLLNNFNSYITFGTGTSNTERLRITSAGIACFACQICTPLVTVNDAVRLYSNASGIGCAYIVTASGGDEQPAIILEKAGGFGQSEIRTYYSNVPNYGLAFRVGNTTGMYINSSGNVGISTSPTIGKLHVNGTANNTIGFFGASDMAASTSVYLQIGKNQSSVNNAGEVSFRYCADNSDCNMVSLGFYGNGQKLNVTKGGCVGIGTMQPNRLLTIAGDVSFYNGAGGEGAIDPGAHEVISTGFNIVGQSSLDLSNITLTSNRWKAVLRGVFANNNEGGALTSPVLEIEVDSNSPTIDVGSTDLTFSRNSTTGKLQVTNNGANNIRATFVGTIHVVNSPQSGLPNVSKVMLGTACIGGLVYGGGGGCFKSRSDARVLFLKQNTATTDNIIQFIDHNNTFIWELVGRNNTFYIYNNNVSNYSMCINPGTNAVHFPGAVSKGSGTFNIEHPLESKKCTHRLVHSFIEGPQADLIYRGVTNLINGVACVNIDCAARMTEGTFEALNRCIQVFTTNESSWDAIRGKMCGNILVIESQNIKSTDKISWMVIGERQDKHIKETSITDEFGRIIVEPEIEEQFTCICIQ